MTLRPTILLSLLVIAGCGVKAPIEGRQDPYTPSQIMFADKGLKNRTAVGAPQLARSEDGSILHVTVPIRATSNEQIPIDYRASFFDRNGQLLGQSGWFTKTLAPNVPDQITVNSLSPRATDFQIDFRYAR